MTDSAQRPPSDRGPARIVVVDDHPLLQEGLVKVLGQEADFEVVGTAGSIAEAVAEIERRRPDLLLLDHQLPDGPGIDACPRFLELDPALRIVVFTLFDSPDLANRALAAGAHGYLVKIGDPRRLIAALRSAFEGDRPNDSQAPGYGLTAQELDVLSLLAEGLTNVSIARRLAISPETVKAHVRALMAKLGATNRTQAVAVAIARGRVLPTNRDVDRDPP